MIKKPASLPTSLADLWITIAAQVKPKTPPAIVELMCSHASNARRARKSIDNDGLMVRDGKNNPIVHPAIAQEERSNKELAKLMNRWAL